MEENKPNTNNTKTIVNSAIWWGGLICYAIYYSKAHPNAGFFASLFDLWGVLIVIILWIIQALVSAIFFKNK
jgi:hypothetical protein